MNMPILSASSPQSSRCVTPSVSSPMASLLPKNYITVNVDSEVGYSYSFPADLATLNPLSEAELPHSSCNTPSPPPDLEPMDISDVRPMDTSDPCSTASLVGDH